MFQVNGGVSSLTVGGVGSVSVTSFTIRRQLAVNSGVAAGLGTGDLFTVHLTGISLQAGGSSASLLLTGGTLDAYSFTTATLNYLYVAGTSLHLVATLGPVTADVSGVDFFYNPSTASNWAFAGGPSSVSAQTFQVSGGVCSLTLGDLGSVSVTSFTIRRRLALNSGVAAGLGTGDLFTVHLAGISLQAGGSTASLLLTGGTLYAYSFTTATLAYLYVAGTNLHLVATLGPVTADIAGVNFFYNPSTATNWAFAGGPSSVSAQTFQVSGGVSSLTLGDLGSVSVTSFTIRRQLALDSGVAAGLGTGDLFTVHLAGISLQAGGSTASLLLTGGTLYAYSFTTATLAYLYVAGTNLHLVATLGPVTADIAGVNFFYNPSTATNWAFAGGPSSVSAQTFQVSGGVSSLTLGDLGSVSVTSFTIRRQLALDSGVAAGLGTGDLFTVHLAGISLQAGGSSASLLLTGGTLDAYSFTTATLNYLYVAGTSLHLVATLGPVTADVSGVDFFYNPSTATNWAFAGGPASVSAQTFQVSGGVSSLTLGDLGSVSVTSFTIRRQLAVNSGVAAGLGTGDLFTVHLTGISLQAGGSSASLLLTGGTLDAYSFTTATLNYLYVAGTSLHLVATLGPVTADVSGVNFFYNPSTATNWAFAGGPSSVSAQTFQVSGGVSSVPLGDLGAVSGPSFTVRRQLALDSGVAAGLGTGDLFTVHLAGISLQAGGSSASLLLTGGTLDAYSFTTATLNYLYVAGTNLHLVATLGPVTADISGVSFFYNPSTATSWAFAGGPASVSAQTFQVSGGVSSLTLGDLGSVSVTSFTIRRQLALNSGVAAGLGTGDLFTVHLAGISLQAGGSNASLLLTGGTLDAYSFTTATLAYLYVAGTSLHLVATLGPVTADVSGVDFFYNPSTATNWAFAGGPSSVSAQTFQVSGGVSSLTLGDLGSVSMTSFTIRRQLALDSGVAAGLGTGDLFTVHLAGISLQAGGSSASLLLTGGTLDAYSFTTATLNYLYVAGTSLHLVATLGPVTADVSGVDFFYNPSTATNWAFAGGPASVSAQTFQVSGGVSSLTLGDLGSVSVTSFTIRRQLALNSGVAAGLGTGDLFTVHLTGISLQAGGSNASLLLTGGTLDAYSFTNATLNYLYVAGTNLHLVATLGPVTADVSGVDFFYNPSTATNWAFAGGPASVSAQSFQVPGGVSSLTLGDLGSVSVTSFTIRRQLALNSGVAAGFAAGHLFPVHLPGATPPAGGPHPSLRSSRGPLASSPRPPPRPPL